MILNCKKTKFAKVKKCFQGLETFSLESLLKKIKVR